MDNITVLIVDPPKTTKDRRDYEHIGNPTGHCWWHHRASTFNPCINKKGKEQGLPYNCRYANKEIYGPFIIARRDRVKVASMEPDDVVV